MIELDPSIPWEPPEASPPPRVRARRRWIALVAVALITAGTLVAAVPRAGTGPVFTVDDFRILSLQTGGGRLIAGRFQPVGAGTQAEVLSLRDGTRLWSRTLDVDQHLTFLTDNVMALVTDMPSGRAGALTALDAATGEQLWQAAQFAYLGQSGGRIFAEDMAGVVEQPHVVDVRPSGEVPVNPVPEQGGRRYVALDERTGATVWEFRVPEGSGIDFSWVGGERGPAFMSELSPTGLLRIRDLGTGVVVAQNQLDWSGTVSSFAMDRAFPGPGSTVPGQVLIAKAGEQGTDVYDRGSGRLLWHWPADRSSTWDGGDPYPCAVDLYCLRDESGMAAIDPRTGARLWHVDGYNGVLSRDGDILVVTSWGPAANAAPPVAALDARTGRVVRAVEGWQFTGIVTGRGLVMWKSVDDRTAVLGVVDPRSGRVTVFGTSASWHGNAECSRDRTMLACLVDGALAVWKLP
ncbi:PQQ-binding-like beta-propeller repeat protein [Dactylosporangium sp. NPDC051485]|uniref:outer membrane protein assembly factor BamB family protein n=1 Tax=Dactylosporangium sp. NPDC051485 TaxID=3154846 RepID=UPI00344AD2A7